MALALLAFVAAPVSARRDDAQPAVSAVLAAYERATGAPENVTIETRGTVTGVGLTGTFHAWRAGDDERSDERLGPRGETTLRLGDRTWVRNTNGFVRELRGVLRRRALTEAFIDSGRFLRAPQRSTFAGYGTIGARRAWRLVVRADGGDPQTLWVDVRSGRPLRLEYLDGDGATWVDLSDWRRVAGRNVPFRSVTSDGRHAFDIVEQITTVRIGGPIDRAVFAPLRGRALRVERVQTVSLLDLGGHIGVRVTIGGRPFTFLVDSGAQNILLDTRVARQLGLIEAGALEVRGAVRSGGLHIARLARLEIGEAVLDDVVVSTLDLGTMLGTVRVDGILGAPFFAGALVELDLRGRTMRFGAPGAFVSAGERIALDVDRELPEAMARVGGRVDAPFLIDTGNSGGLLLYRPFAERHPELVARTGQSAQNFGVGGVTRSYRTQLDLLTLGGITLAQRSVEVVLAIEGAFADRFDAGNIGLGVLRDFIVTFDMANAALYLQPATSP